MKSNIYKPIFKTIVSLFCILSSMTLSAQWSSKVPQNTDTLWTLYNQVIDANTVWMGGNQYYFDTANKPRPGNFVSMYSTKDGGTNWRYKKFDVDTATSPFLSGITGIDGMKGWASIYQMAVGVNMVLRTRDGGLNWDTTATTTYVDPESFINGIAFKDTMNGVMIGDPIQGPDTTYHFEIYRTSNAGKTWLRIANSKVPDPLADEYGISGEIQRIGDKIWFTTDQGRIIYSNDGGQNWQFSWAGTGYTAFLHFVDNLHGICISADSMISKTSSLQIKYTSDGGVNWQYVKSPFKDSTYFWSVSLIPGSNYILTNNAATLQGAPFTTLLSKDSGRTWMVIGTGDGLAGAQFLSASLGYAGSGISLGQNYGTKIFKYTGNPITGLFTELALKAEFSLYPNPFTDKISMDIKLAKPSSLLILVNSTDGKLVWNREITSPVSSYHDDVDLKSLPAGTYIITVSSPEGFVSKTFIKQ